MDLALHHLSEKLLKALLMFRLDRHGFFVRCFHLTLPDGDLNLQNSWLVLLESTTEQYKAE